MFVFKLNNKTMRKNILTVVAVLVFGFVNAQETTFGLKGGGDFASFTGNVKKTGFYFGGYADITLSEKFHIQPELLYVSIDDFKNQIQVPILARIPIVEDFSVMAGPDLGYIIDASAGMKSFNYGLDFGASFDVSEDFSLDAKYNLGLANLVEGGGSDSSYKVSGLFVGLGYKF